MKLLLLTLLFTSSALAQTGQWKYVGLVGLIKKDGTYSKFSTSKLKGSVTPTTTYPKGQYELQAVNKAGHSISSIKFTPSFKVAFCGSSDDLDNGISEVNVHPVNVIIKINDSVVKIQALKDGVVMQSFPLDTVAEGKK